MKVIVAVFLFLLLFIPVSARAQFEGMIDMKMTKQIEGKPREVLYSMFVKGEMLAAQATGGDEKAKNVKFIFRGDKKIIWVVNDENKSYLEISLTDDTKGGRKRGTDSAPVHSGVELKKTGKTETLLGYPCDEWVAGDTGKSTHIWGTTKLGNVYGGLMKSFEKMSFHRAQSEMQGWESELAKIKVFPLKIVSSKEGKTADAQEVTRIESKHLEASLFEAPAGYKMQSLGANMGKIMEQLQGQMNSKRGGPGDSSMNREDLQKMMKEMQERYGKGQKDAGDTSKDHE